MTHYYGNFKVANTVARKMNRSKRIKGKFVVKKTVRGSYRIKRIRSYDKYQR